PIEDIVAEVERLCANGTVEINLVSQDTVSYGRDLEGKPNLAKLVRALLEVRALGWLRLFYLYPEKLDPELLELFAQGGKLVPYLDVPFQHATDRMLKVMRRGYNAARQREFIDRLRARVPGLFIRTAFIVGHPEETEEDFDGLLEFVKSAQLDHVGVFRYSHEEGTHSGTLQQLVAAKTIERRANAIMKAQRAISKKRLRALVGSELEVLVEGESDESELLLVGRHAGQAPDIDGTVQLINGAAQPGDIRRVRITQSSSYDLVGDLSLGEDDPLRPAPKLRHSKRLNVVA
ncbi:MAG TPA: radical SAM protein, partial [Polyangiales bacterium]|nr:radical SAM protein [Polyangiales bacterium]